MKLKALNTNQDYSVWQHFGMIKYQEVVYNLLQKIDNSYFVFSGIMISNSLLSASKRKEPIKKKEKRKGRNTETERVKHKIAFKAFSYISGCLGGHISAVLGVHDLASETRI